MDDKRLLLAEVELGLDVRAFLGTDVGKLIAGRAEHDLVTARLELEAADPEDPKLIRSIQNRIAVARNVITWLEEAIGNGRQAEAVLHEQDASE